MVKIPFKIDVARSSETMTHFYYSERCRSSEGRNQHSDAQIKF